MDMHSYFPDLTCDICNSSDIIDTRENYVCRSCGMVLEVQKLEYYRPYEESRIQYATLGTTQIGTMRERFQHGDSDHLLRLNKIHSNIRSSRETVFSHAERVMNTLFATLNLPEGMKPIILSKFKEIRAKIDPGKKYRTPDKLIPLTTYFVFKTHNLPIQETQLLEVSKITKREFNRFKLEIPEVFPHYIKRDRKEYILQRILEITEKYGLGMEFFHRAKEIFIKFWSILSNTKDDVVAGVVSAMAILCDRVQKISINGLCRSIGIKMSTIQCQVKNKIFQQFRISGFISLIKSSDILRKFLLKVLESDHLSFTVKSTIHQVTSSPEAPRKTSKKMPRKLLKKLVPANQESPRKIRVGVIRTIHFFRTFKNLLQEIIQKKRIPLSSFLFIERNRELFTFKDGKGPPSPLSP